VILASASGEREGMSSKDGDLVNRVIAAISIAIADSVVSSALLPACEGATLTLGRIMSRAQAYLVGRNRRKFLDELLALDRGTPTEEYTFVARLLEPRPAIASPEPQFACRVFLSYAVEDRERVRRLYRRLKDDGHLPWLDVVELLPGMEWKPAIAAALRSADIAILCLSRRSIEKTGMVQVEMRQVLELLLQRPFGKIGLIPARLEECEVPEPLRAYQWVDLFRGGGYAKLSRTLREATRA
jgi:hypothetical protein